MTDKELAKKINLVTTTAGWMAFRLNTLYGTNMTMEDVIEFLTSPGNLFREIAIALREEMEFDVGHRHLTAGSILVDAEMIMEDVCFLRRNNFL